MNLGQLPDRTKLEPVQLPTTIGGKRGSFRRHGFGKATIRRHARGAHQKPCVPEDVPRNAEDARDADPASPASSALRG